MHGGRFDFDDGGTYCGGWDDGKAHGHGVCTGPKGQGEYSGAWHYGFEVSGVYTWPSGNGYDGQWQNGKRHGLGVERRGRWAYRGEWTQGFKGRYGVRYSTNSNARYEGTWANGLQDGYGQETYADGGLYQGQWMRGMRHGYGIRKSAPHGIAAKYRSRSHAHASLSSMRSDQSDDNYERDLKRVPEDSRGGFVLRARSELASGHRSLSERSVAVKRTILQSLRFKKQLSTGDIDKTGALRSTGSIASCASDDSSSTGGTHRKHRGDRNRDQADSSGAYGAVEEFVDPNAIETYAGEWKNDKRSGYGVSERTDGLRYEGEWLNNRKCGYGVTMFKDGSKEEGKYKNNVLVTSQRKMHLLFVRTSKLRERIDNALAAAQRAMQIAQQKADVGISRAVTARERADQADVAGLQAREDAELAKIFSKQLAPELCRTDVDDLRNLQMEVANHVGLSPSKIRLGTGGSASPSQPHSPSMGLRTPKTTMGATHRGSPPGPIAPQQPPQLADFLHNYSPSASAQQTTGQNAIGPEAYTGPASGSNLSAHPGEGSAPYDSILMKVPPVQHMQVAFHGQPDLGYSNMVPPPQHKLFDGGSYGSVQRQPQQAVNLNQSYGQYLTGDIVPQPKIFTVQAPETAYNLIPGAKPLPSPRPNVSSPQPPQPSDQSTTLHTAADDQPLKCTGSRSRRPAALSLVRTHSDKRGLVHQNAELYDLYEQYRPDSSSSYSRSFDERGGGAAADASREPGLRVRAGGGRAAETLRQNRRATVLGGRDDEIAKAAAKMLGLAEDGDAAMMNGWPENAPTRLATGNYAGHPSTLCSRGSEPDLTELTRASVEQLINREEIARLGSQRRQEIMRHREDQEMLRANPVLRACKYVYRPEVKTWILRYKLPLLLIIFNVCLSIFFCQLLTYPRRPKFDPNHDQDDPY